MVKRSGERGNIFFTLFGAVAIVGILGAGVMATMRGPLSTIVEVNNRTRAETQMTIAAKLAMIEAVDTVGDCDSDGYIEPLEHTVAAPNPTGGGQLPAAVGSNKIDPWDTEIGYCAWDAGPDNSTCVGTRLTGSGADDETYTMMAIISAGPDGIFQSSCANHPGLVTKGGDDIVQEYSYADARGAIYGLTRATGPAELAQATLESVCYQTHDLIEAMRGDWTSSGDTVLRVDGGMVASDWTMQRLADLIAAPVDRPSVLETTALGAAWLAGMKSGVWPDADGFAKAWLRDRRFEPQMDEGIRSAKLDGWRDAVRRTLTAR